MSQVAPVRKMWRKSFRGIPTVAPRRRRSTLAPAPEVQSITDDHVPLSSCPFHRASQKLSNAAAEITTFHPLVKNVDHSRIKSFDEIPTPFQLPILGSVPAIILSGGATKIHLYTDRLHKQLGPIFKDKLGTEDCVIINAKEYIDTVYLNEGKYPVNLVPEAWKLYNEETGTKRGIFFMEGNHWCERRRLLNNALMSSEAVTDHATAFKGVTTDLVQRWEDITTNQRWIWNDGMLGNLEKELYNWAVESLSTMLFGRRLGCVQPYDGSNERKYHEFVDCVGQIFEQSAKMTMIPPKVARRLRLPMWQRFHKAATQAICLARGYVEERLSEIRTLQEQGQHVSGVLYQLMSAKDITEDEIVSIVADLIIAAADTTSHAAQWALYSLARNPRCQEVLLSQIKQAVAPGETVEVHHLEKIPYAMHIVRESLRLYPVASFLSRKLAVDVVLGGYKVPAGTLIVMSQYTIGRDPKNFHDPEEFKPERWERQQRKLEPGSKVCTPFGVGARACVGRRVTECKTPLMLCNVIQKFHLESANRREIKPIMRMITAPNTPIKLKLHVRD